MEKEFVPHDLSLKMIKLGFDEPCFMKYKMFSNGNARLDNIRGYQMYPNENVSYSIKAPLWQQAFDFLLEKIDYKIIPVIYKTYDKFYYCSGSKFETLYEARLGCVEKLIELTELKTKQRFKK